MTENSTPIITRAHRAHTLRAAPCMLCQTMGMALCMSVQS